VSPAVGILKGNTGRHANAGNFSAIVDIKCRHQLQARVPRNQTIQVNHGAALLPQKCARGLKAYPRSAHNLAFRIYALRLTTRIAGHSSEIGHDALPPQKSVPHPVAWVIGNADNISLIVNPEWLSVIPSKSAQIRERSTVPEKRMDL